MGEVGEFEPHGPQYAGQRPLAKRDDHRPSRPPAFRPVVRSQTTWARSTQAIATLPSSSRASALTRRVSSSTRAVARADGLDAVQDTHPVAVIRPGISIEKTGPERQFVFTPARYDISFVRNTGDVALTDVVVTDTIPERAELIDRGGAEVRGRNLTWTIAEPRRWPRAQLPSIAYTANAPLTRDQRGCRLKRPAGSAMMTAPPTVFVCASRNQVRFSSTYA